LSSVIFSRLRRTELAFVTIAELANEGDLMGTGIPAWHSRLLTLVILIGIAALAACGTDDSDGNSDIGESQQIPPTVPASESDSTSQQTEESDNQENAESQVSGESDDEAPNGEGLERLQQLDIEIELFVEGFVSPTDIVALPGRSDRLLVVSRVGTIQIVDDGEIREEPFLDIQDKVEHHMVEQGMLSIALHPDFENNGYFYVYYISHGEENSIISRFEMSEDGQRAEPESETLILEVEQPHYSHNGGSLKFGPDGYLYIGLGDGEDPGDPHGHSQNPGTMLGSILRIDVDGGDPYGIPPDNPFIEDDNALDEVWAYGLRNPWRFSFDPATGDMYMVDVGQWEREEVNVQPAESAGGENYGWPIMEGDQCWEADECDAEGLTMPVVTYDNPANGCAIIGGYPYRGNSYPELAGIYFFGDWCSGNIWGMVEEDGEWNKEVLVETDLMINAFGLDRDGEIYVLNFEEGGGIFRITAN
jgi:glucose/arabinose dehydrogenase